MVRYSCLRRGILNQVLLFLAAVIVGFLTTVILLFLQHNLKLRPSSPVKYPVIPKYVFQEKSNDYYARFIRWNRTLCSTKSDHRGPHQKVIAISIYATGSKFADNPMYSWERNLLVFLKPLAEEIHLLLPQWILRVYIDFSGSSKSQREFFNNFSNIDVCDINALSIVDFSFISHLSGRMWRFLPIFDPFVDYLLSRDLDSPIIPCEIETIDLWLSPYQRKNFFYIARDHIQHGVPILGGLWGASLRTAREELFDIFKPMLLPSIAEFYRNVGDQNFLADIVWNSVKNNALIFDSYSCQTLGGRSFLSRRPNGNCYLGCIRPCCEKTNNQTTTMKPCPIECRPRKHRDWIYC